MLNRREFCQAVAGAAALSILPTPSFADQAVPTLFDRQRAFVDLQFGMFVHFNMATFQDREWGDPAGPVEAFDPDQLDTDQWAAAAVSAKMRYGCLTTKHHDGFCIWPTRTDVASVGQTPRKLDVVKAYTDSFHKAGLSVGLYYSILDLRNDIRHFNVTPEKVGLIKSQLTELLSDYGAIDLLIFDGWDAPWSRIGYDEVVFREIYDLVKKLQPGCLISEVNASQYPASGLYYSDIKAYEQNAGQKLPADSDLPAQSCATITDGWFYKTGDDKGRLKSAEQVVEQWLKPQNGRHCNLILNAPPDRHGRLTPNVVARLAEVGKLWTPTPAGPLQPSVVVTTKNLATGRPIRGSASPDTVGPDLAVDGNFKSGWSTVDDAKDGWLEVTLPGKTPFDTVAFYEPIGSSRTYAGSRIGSFTFEAKVGDDWRPVATGNGGRAVQICPIPRTTASAVRLRFTCKSAVRINDLGVYDERRG